MAEKNNNKSGTKKNSAEEAPYNEFTTPIETQGEFDQYIIKEKAWTNLNPWAILYITLSDPTYSRLSYIVLVIILYYIVVSCACFIVSTYKDYRDPAEDDQLDVERAHQIFGAVETITIALFTVEYFVRLFTSSHVILDEKKGDYPETWTVAFKRMKHFAGQALNVIDLLAIVPFYLEHMIHHGLRGFSVLRVFRLLRLFRILKLSRHYRRVVMIIRVLKKSWDAFELFLSFAVAASIIFGSLIFFAEVGTYDRETGLYMREDIYGRYLEEQTPFLSVIHSMYWVFISTTTVGYGDLYVTTPIGRSISFVTVHVGIVFLALPIVVIGTHFSNEYAEVVKEEQEYKEEQERERLRAEGICACKCTCSLPDYSPTTVSPQKIRQQLLDLTTPRKFRPKAINSSTFSSTSAILLRQSLMELKASRSMSHPSISEREELKRLRSLVSLMKLVKTKKM